VPTVSPKQADNEKTTLSSKTKIKPVSSVSPKQQTAEKPKTKLSRTPDTNYASSNTAVASKTPGVKGHSSATAAKATASDSIKKDDSSVHSQANCLQVEAQYNGESEATLAPADAIEHESVRSKEENASMSEDKDASSTVNESDADAAAAGDDDKDSDGVSDNDSGESNTPVSFILLTCT